MDQSTALFASVAVEAVTVALLLARRGRRTLLRGMTTAVLATTVTHPLAWWGVETLEPAIGYWAAVLAVEALVCLAEAVAYRLVVALDWPTALGLSVVTNGASTLAGLLFYAATS